MLHTIDINADLGEGSLNDAQLMPLISSCSIACGGHFGNETTMRTAVQLAKKHKVKIGAHPSYPDVKNFGRKVLPIPKNLLSEAVHQQLVRFISICESEDIQVHHMATQVRPKLYVPYGSVLAKKAKPLLPLEYEAFIDRTYNDDLSLVSRTEKDAVIYEPNPAWSQLQLMVENNLVQTRKLNKVSIVANTYCIHSDTPNVIEILSFIRQQMKQFHIGLNK